MINGDQVKVVKFGGSSLSEAEQFRKVKKIIISDKARKYVIPSAPGKRFGDDTKVTDMLINCFKNASDSDYINVFNSIRERYFSIINDLSLTVNLDEDFREIEENLKKGSSIDYMASRGEYLNGKLLANYLGFDFVDAAEVVFFDGDGQYDQKKTNSVMSKVLSEHKYAVIPGFYGSMPDGKIKTFSRGGSDITGAIVSGAVKADLYENWTDVSGFLMCDPRIVKDPKPIKKITYRELRELSYMGATVLHEDSIFPVKNAGIPINIKNTNSPEDSGTLIVPYSDNDKNNDIITGIAGKKGFSVLHIEKDMMNQEVGFGMKVLKVLYDFNIGFEHFPSGIDTMSIIINKSDMDGREKDIIRKVSEAVNPDHISVQTGLSLIAVVGRNMINTPGTASRVFSSIAKNNVNIRMIDQGSSELNIIIGVDEKDFNTAIKAIYNEFCS